MAIQQSTRDRLKALLKKAGVENSPNGGVAYTNKNNNVASISAPKPLAEEIEYNAQQQGFISTVVAGEPCVLTGPAGSGKTTTVRGAIDAAIASGRIGEMAGTHKWLAPGSPAIACCSFTNKAVNNLKGALPKSLHKNCLTIHKLLEFQPEYISVFDEETGEDRTTMQFVPGRHSGNPLPHIDILLIDEATMTDVPLWNKLVDALPDSVQVVLIGDIHQLPPVFGKSIFIWAMQLGARVVELTHVYRQALKSPIIRLATRVREGKQIPQKELETFNHSDEHGTVTIKPWKKKLGETAAIKTISMFLPQLIDSGQYDPMLDVILTPYNKSFGTIVMNNAVAAHLASLETDPTKKEVWEIYSGIHKKYFRIGEKVLYNKSEAYITNIERNRSYYGKLPRLPSPTMDYNGVESDPIRRMESDATKHGGMEDLESIDSMLAHMGSHTDGEDKVSREASHKITVYIPDTDSKLELTASGEINTMDLGYALTVHKSQGSEYDRVFFITHGCQANMFFRELLYTAITRAARELYIICEPNLFVKGITTQRVPGNTLEDKIESFARTVKLGKQGQDELPRRSELLTGVRELEEA